MKKSLLGIFLMAILSVLSLENSGILNAQTNLALGQPVTASSVRTYAAANAVDGNASTRWSSSYDEPEWIYVDLGQTYSINQVVLSWETAYGTGYEIQVSDDAASWTTIYSTSTGNGGIDDLTGLSGSGRYVRMYGITRATHWGFSIWEFEVYGATTTPVTGVSVSPTSLTLDEGQTSDLTETVSPSNATDQSVTWSSSNTSVATVNASGLVTAVASGNATITVTTNDGSFTANCAVTVNAPVVASNVALNKSIAVSAYQDDSFGYKPGENLVDGDVSDDARWSASGFPQWAEIDLGANYELTEIDLYPYQNRAYQYIVEAKADGGSYATIVDRSSNTTGGDVLTDNVSVTARYVKITVSGLSGSSSSWVSLSELEVYGVAASTVPVTGVSVAPTSLTLDEGQTSDLTETVSPANATDQSVIWSSNNSSVATVNSNGLVTAVAEGNAIITVTTNDGSFTANCAVTVNAVSGGLPSPWAGSDVGSVAAAGSEDYSAGTFTVQGSGSNIWGTADEFHFVYQQITGDATIIARIATLTQVDQWTKGGVMMRESLNANSINGHTFLAPITSNGSKFSYRTTTGATTSEFDGPNVTAPYWLRMERSGNTFTSAVSSDGSSWTTVGSTTLNMSSTYYVGLVVSSLADGTLATGTFDNVSVSGTVTPPDTQAPSAPSGLTSGAVSSTSVALSWNASTDNEGVAGYKVYGGPSVVTASSTSTIVYGLTPSTSYTFTVKAFDAAGNESTASNSHSVTTTAGGGTGDWPTPATTGPSGTLTNYSGDVITTSDGQVIENLNVIGGGMVVRHQNVTIRNCKFGALDIQTYTPTTGLNCVVEDCELQWAGRQNYTLRRCYMNVVSEDLLRFGGGNILVEDCYLYIDGPRKDGAHSDNIQIIPVGDYPNIVIRHNTLYNSLEATSVINGSYMTIENNLIAGGSYAIYTSRSTLINNHFSTIFFPNCGLYGAINGNGTDNTCIGNVWHESGLPMACPNSGEVELAENAVEQGIKMYPNPLNSDMLNIQINDYDIYGDINVNITDLTGRTVYSQLHEAQSVLNISVGNLSKGIYVVSVNGEQQKLIVE